MQNVQLLWNNVEQQIDETIEQLVQQKSSYAAKSLKLALLLGGVVTLFCFIPGGLYPLIGLGTFLLVWLICWLYSIHKLNTRYKSQVMPKLLQTVCPGAIYEPKGTLTKDIFKGAEMYPTGWGEKFENEDTIRGKVGKTDFVYGEVELYHMQSTGKSAVKVVDFKGFVFEADFNKHFNGTTMLTSEKGFLSNVGPGLFSKMKRCKLEDVDFERLYTTYTTNDQEARYILTPALQQRIMEMNKVFSTQLGDKHLSMSFRGSRLLIAVPSKTNRFEVKFNLAEVKKDLLALSTMIDVIEQLNLNLRIWSKE